MLLKREEKIWIQLDKRNFYPHLLIFSNILHSSHSFSSSTSWLWISYDKISNWSGRLNTVTINKRFSPFFKLIIDLEQQLWYSINLSSIPAPPHHHQHHQTWSFFTFWHQTWSLPFSKLHFTWQSIQASFKNNPIIMIIIIFNNLV